MREEVGCNKPMRLHPGAAVDSRGRLYASLPGKDARSAFRRDRDRILHSTAFRRLHYKTQVFVFHEGDFFKTRLTHSLEVAQISQTLAGMLGANEELAEAIALAHDVGHPPFGHAGEEALGAILAQHGMSFEHNGQALRIVDELEERYPEHPGLNLTWETREGIARHSTFFDSPQPPEMFCEYVQGGLECQIASAADVIAYCTHDLEDALKMRLIRQEDLADVLLWQRGREYRCGDVHRLSPMSHIAASIRVHFTIRNMIELLIRDVVASSQARLEELKVHHADDVRRADAPVVCFSETTHHHLEALKDYLYERVYKDPRTLRMAHKGQMVIERLFGVFYEKPELLPQATAERLRASGDKARVIADHIAGMTDRYAMDLYNTLFEPYTPGLHLMG
jgi:dGTPase